MFDRENIMVIIFFGVIYVNVYLPIIRIFDTSK